MWLGEYIGEFGEIRLLNLLKLKRKGTLSGLVGEFIVFALLEKVNMLLNVEVLILLDGFRVELDRGQGTIGWVRVELDGVRVELYGVRVE